MINRIAKYCLAVIAILLVASAVQSSPQDTQTTSSISSYNILSFTTPDNWMVINETDSLSAYEIRYPATEATSDSANAVIAIRSELAEAGLTTASDQIRALSTMPPTAALLNDVVTTNSPWRTLVWLSAIEATPYVIVDCFALTTQPVIARFAFPLMPNTDGFESFLEQTNDVMASLQCRQFSFDSGSLEAKDGLLRFSATGYDHINPNGTYDMAVVYAPANLDATTSRTVRRPNSRATRNSNCNVPHVGDVSVGSAN